ncbi:hypothetical protein [Clostridium saccharoperbutylacetonicum]|uniref:hypothetical protein n=1 Tax=Clostridium saccharoperbutylacetonicum TaxID=36745 RepID=UPI00098403A7|nr:hypothetical protein [Clostridium saccharoperbutylacetonicum]AQR93359.1 hypothetical protein CLSAP_06570 [Clostridium saccharoperbutylacetonicum]AQR93368.1 hypothetical protein CLSAP_06660 [Clostridium saccharoperbutylacetonicum]NSB29065.1 hypothetical protein [Clostridium saccharoperbutylacetonicum]NSB34776.1 hypothetical protein [Clostridium saccharoperbutylacetonicum]
MTLGKLLLLILSLVLGCIFTVILSSFIFNSFAFEGMIGFVIGVAWTSLYLGVLAKLFSKK